MTRIEAATGSEIDRTTLSPSAGQVILSEQYALSSADGKLCALKYGMPFPLLKMQTSVGTKNLKLLPTIRHVLINSHA